jgi:Zn finger protein HypA/HybF involved in hydrogenase expression
MHELSIASDILDIIKPKITDPLRLKLVSVSATSLSGICFSHLSFCFNELCRIKGYPNATLEIKTTAVHKQCLQCGIEFECVYVDTVCPECSSSYGKITRGSPFNVDYIEVL